MYMKLDEEVERLLCCSLCKSDLVKCTEGFICKSCGLRFPSRIVRTDDKNEEIVYDFRIFHPPYCIPEGLESWKDAQSKYEQCHEQRIENDSLQQYLDEIDSVREIYTQEYHIEGKVLDVGGYLGSLRHYLGTDVNLYVSADPYIDIFAGIGLQPNLLHAFPCMSEPCNFISAHAEYLPFKSGSFDWIHMRSVVDHFADPYIAFLEAFRCSRVGGKLLVGMLILEKKKVKRDGFIGLLHTISTKFLRFRSIDDHMFRLTQSELMDLFMKTGWDVVKEHWQKAPFQSCIYACGQKREPVPLAQVSATQDSGT